MFDDGWLADLIAFVWWKHDADNEIRKGAFPSTDPGAPPKNEKVRKAWNAVVGEWDDERSSH